jgi:hypothetical protein
MDQEANSSRIDEDEYGRTLRDMKFQDLVDAWTIANEPGNIAEDKEEYYLTHSVQKKLDHDLSKHHSDYREPHKKLKFAAKVEAITLAVCEQLRAHNFIVS